MHARISEAKAIISVEACSSFSLPAVLAAESGNIRTAVFMTTSAAFGISRCSICAKIPSCVAMRCGLRMDLLSDPDRKLENQLDADRARRFRAPVVNDLSDTLGQLRELLDQPSGEKPSCSTIWR